MRPEEVAKFLKDNPQFFDEYGELLASIQVRHPHGKHAIPLSERQVLTLRERGRALEGKLRELIQFGEENDTTSDRVHRLSLGLMSARDVDAVVRALEKSMREDFNVTDVALRLWPRSPAQPQAQHEPISEEMRVFADSLANPYFCEKPMFESSEWFDAAGAAITSLVYIPIRAQRPFGVLALGSADAHRFTADMGTLYVVRMAELISAALGRYVEV